MVISHLRGITHDLSVNLRFYRLAIRDRGGDSRSDFCSDDGQVKCRGRCAGLRLELCYWHSRGGLGMAMGAHPDDCVAQVVLLGMYTTRVVVRMNERS